MRQRGKPARRASRRAPRAKRRYASRSARAPVGCFASTPSKASCSALLGGLAGIAIGRAGLAVLIALRPPALNRIDAASMDSTVMAFTVAVALAWGLLLSLAPLAEVRHASGHSLSSPRRRWWYASSALSVVLLVGAGLLVRAFLQVVRSDAGFRADDIVTFRVAQNWQRYESPESMNAFSAEFRARLAKLPGVTGVGAISHLPYDDGLPNWGTPYVNPGETDLANAGTADTRAVMPGFFEALGARLVEGRFFSEADDPGSMPVTIVDERLAQRMWPGQSAIGKRLVGDPQTSGRPSVTVTVVGVVRHLRHRRPDADVREQLYYPSSRRRGIQWRTSSGARWTSIDWRRRFATLSRNWTLTRRRPTCAFLRTTSAQHVPARRFATILVATFALVSLRPCWDGRLRRRRVRGRAPASRARRAGGAWRDGQSRGEARDGRERASGHHGDLPRSHRRRHRRGVPAHPAVWRHASGPDLVRRLGASARERRAPGRLAAGTPCDPRESAGIAAGMKNASCPASAGPAGSEGPGLHARYVVSGFSRTCRVRRTRPTCMVRRVRL